MIMHRGRARRTRAIRLAALAAVAATLLAAAWNSPVAAQEDDREWLADCERRADRRSDERYTSCDVRVERVSARGTVRVDARVNGGIIVRGANRSDIEVHARIQTTARSASAARAMLDDIDVSAGSTIRAEGPDTERGEWWSVTFVVYVPARSDLELVAQNGPVAVYDVDGRIEARTQNGPLSLRDVSGDVTARTQNGPLDIELAGRTWEGEGLDAETHNGPVRLSIPEGYSARLQTGTVNGPFTTDVPLTVTFLGRRYQRIDTTLGNGGATVRAVTTNGPVVIRQR